MAAPFFDAAATVIPTHHGSRFVAIRPPWARALLGLAFAAGVHWHH